MQRLSIALAAAVFSALVGAGSAGAAAITQPAGLLSAATAAIETPGIETPGIELVRQGCGAGFHRGPYGGCRRNVAPRGPWGRNACWWRGGVKVCR